MVSLTSEHDYLFLFGFKVFFKGSFDLPLLLPVIFLFRGHGLRVCKAPEEN